jgi:hypothetical protein
MSRVVFSQAERELIERYFGCSLEALADADYKKISRQLLARHHPDAHAGQSPEEIERLTEQFQELQALVQKVRLHFAPEVRDDELDERIRDPEARFAYQRMNFEVMTSHKGFKYLIMRSRFARLERGDQLRIPQSSAFLVVNEDYQGISVGFQESVKMYLTFHPEDAVEQVVWWLFLHLLLFGISNLRIEGQRVPVEYEEMLRAVKRKSLLRLEA